MWKKCTKCGKHKALWAFDRHKKLQFNTTTQCKTCKKIQDAQYYQNNKNKLLKQMTSYRKENREEIRKRDRINNNTNHRRLMNRAWRNKNKDEINKNARKYYHETHERRLELSRKWINKNRKEVYARMRKKYHDKAKYEYYAHRLTIDEDPRLAKDGISLEVRCKFCKKYFIPTKGATYNRIEALNNIKPGIGELSLYCSDECKLACPVYWRKGSLKGRKPSNRISINKVLRKIVFKRCNYICEKCKKAGATICHHIIPVAYDPMLQFDPDNCMGVCRHCHDEIHQQPGCTYPELAKYSVNNCDI